jgi:hypothetical protein
LTPERCEEIIRDTQAQLKDRFSPRKVCAICDYLMPASSVTGIKFCDLDIDLLNKRICFLAELGSKTPVQSVFDEYSIANFDQRLAGLFLSPRGLFIEEEQVLGIHTCEDCADQLEKDETPDNAIANGNYTGVLPKNLQNFNRTTYELVNLCLPSIWIQTIQGGNAKKLKSHVYMFRNNQDQTIAAKLPRSVCSLDHIRCTMIGPNSNVLQARAKEAYGVEMKNLWSLHQFLKDNNVHYENVEDNPFIPREGNEQVAVTTIAGTENLNLAVEESAAPRHSEPGRSEDVEDEQIKIVMDNAANIDVQEVVERVVVRRGNTFMSDSDPKYVDYCFAQLLPFGRGGPGEKRLKKLSLERWLKHVMRLSHQRFANDSAFILVMFDILARQRAFKSTFLRIKMRPSVAKQAGIATRDDIFDYVTNQTERRDALLKNKPAPPRIETKIGGLFAGITAGMTAFYGSAEERTTVRKMAYSMTSAKGQANIFFTICPNAFDIIQIYAMNQEVPSIFSEQDVAGAARLNKKQTDDINLVLLKKQMHDAATGNPINTAKYFDEIIQSIIDHVLSWDMEAHQSKDKPGMFGFTSGFIGCTETQNSSNLHCHILVWVAGMPRTVKEYTKQVQDEEWARALIRYNESIISSEYPLEIPVTCPGCEIGVLSPKDLPNHCYRRYNSGDVEPTMFECQNCMTNYTITSLLAEIMTKTGECLTDAQMAHFKQRLPALPASDTIKGKVMLTLVLQKEQSHSYKHCSSCYKKTLRTGSKGATCRFLFPKMVFEYTSVGTDGRIHLQRKHGNQWLNSWSELLTRLYKVNHDIKTLTCGEGPGIVYYCLYLVCVFNSIGCTVQKLKSPLKI